MSSSQNRRGNPDKAAQISTNTLCSTDYIDNDQNWINDAKALYQNSDRTAKSKLLDEICKTRSCHRKHAIRLMKSGPRAKSPAQIKRASISVQTSSALAQIWQRSGGLGSRRLHAAMSIWIRALEHCHGSLEPAVHAKLLQLSPATIDRMISRHSSRIEDTIQMKIARICRGLQQSLPELIFPNEPGHVIVREIVLCDKSTKFDTPAIIMYDTQCGWLTIIKRETNLIEALKQAELRLPFPLHSLHYLGSETALQREAREFCWQREEPIHFATNSLEAFYTDMDTTLASGQFELIHNFGVTIRDKDQNYRTPYEILCQLRPETINDSDLAAQQLKLFDAK